MEIKRDRYLNRLISKKFNGLIKVITGILLPIVQGNFFEDLRIRSAEFVTSMEMPGSGKLF